jgi:hypothetical protein
VIQAYDDVNLNLIPASAGYIFAYLNGRYANYAAARKRFPRAQVLGITVEASEDGAVLDVENGDATIAGIYQWLERRKSLGAKGVVYHSAGDIDHMMATMNANGFKHGTDYYLWSAHYTGTPHVCGPYSCGQVRTVTVDGTQWTSTYNRVSLDASTWGAWPDLSLLVARPAPAGVTWADWPASTELREGSEGAAVKVLQTALRDSDLEGCRGVTVTGSVETQTLTALRNFQEKKGLAVDGIAGPETRKALAALNDVPAA